MSNPGAFPVDFGEPVGQVRALIGDTLSVPLDPPVSGQQDFQLFSDAEIEQFLSSGQGSIYRASGFAFMSLAGVAARQAESIRDFDLQIDSRQKAEQLRLQAQWYFGEADRLDGLGEDGYTIVRTGRRWTADELAEINWSDVDYTEFIA